MGTGSSSAPPSARVRASSCAAPGRPPSGPSSAALRLPASGDDLERFWPTRRMDAFDEF